MKGEGLLPQLCAGQGEIQLCLCQLEEKSVGGGEAASSRQRADVGPQVGSGGAHSGPGGYQAAPGHGQHLETGPAEGPGVQSRQVG